MYKDKSVLNSFAKIAAQDYLKNDRKLNESLKKLASDEGLTPDQIQYVAAESNKEVWRSLYDKDKKSGYDFDMADGAKVIDELQIKTASRMINEADLDYNMSPREVRSGTSMTKSASADMEKTAEERAQLKKELTSRMEKLAVARERITEEKIVLASAIENNVLKFVKEARNMIMNEPFDCRKEAIEKVAMFMRSADVGPVTVDLMKKLSYVLKKQGIVKEADLKAPEEYISDKLPAKVINGRHALYVTIQTLVNQHKDYHSLDHKQGLVDDSLPMIKEKIREL